MLPAQAAFTWHRCRFIRQQRRHNTNSYFISLQFGCLVLFNCIRAIFKTILCKVVRTNNWTRRWLPLISLASNKVQSILSSSAGELFPENHPSTVYDIMIYLASSLLCYHNHKQHTVPAFFSTKQQPTQMWFISENSVLTNCVPESQAPTTRDFLAKRSKLACLRRNIMETTELYEKTI